jgi:HEAT repeat protein
VARIREAKVAAEQAEDLSQAEQLQVSTRLAKNLAKESHPAVRQAIVEALGSYRTPAAKEGLRFALRDADRDVRIAACGALAQWATPESYGILAETVRTDTDVDVRLAATRLLGGSEDPVAVGALQSALEDSDPAVQYVAMQSLKQSTGQDPGNDLVEWKRIAREVLPSRNAPGQSPAENSSWR